MSSSRCRICIKENAGVYLFYQDEMNYGSMVKLCAGIEISEDDSLPHSICVECLSVLEITYEFILKCRSSDELLRAELNPDLTANHNVETELKTENDDHISVNNEELDFEKRDSEPDNIFEEETVTKVSYHSSKKKPCKKRKKVKSGPKACATCGLKVNSQSAMEIHIRTHTGEKPYECESCNWRFTSKGLLKRHTESHHMKRERKFICENCSSSFYTKNDLATHLRLHSNERPHICKYCNKRFSQIGSLIRHMRLHTGDKPYTCTTCQKAFSDKSSLKKHFVVHSNEKKFTCHLCNKPLKTLDSLKSHIALHSNERLNVCNFCGASFNLKGNLTTHIKRLHSEKSGVCKVCSKSFSDLDAHMRKHTGEKPFKCEFCNKTFSIRGGLTYHIQFKHKNLNKFRCSIPDCKKTFPMGSMLEYHILKYHTNQTPYMCQHCSRGFYRSSDLSKHLRGTHMELNSHSTRLLLPLKMESC